MTVTIETFTTGLLEQRDNPRVLFYDTSQLQQLKAEEREQGEAILIAWAKNGDTRAIEALDAIAPERAIPLLVSLRGQGQGWFRATVLRTLAKVRGELSDVESLREAIEQLDPMERTLSAYALKQSDKRTAIPLLLDLLDDPTPSVRVHAQEGLVQKLGLEDFDTPRQAPLRSMQLAGMNTLSTLWPYAQKRLRRVFEATLAGATPAELDLIYKPSADPTLGEAIWNIIVDRTQSFSTIQLAEVGAHDNSWFETVMLVRLTSCDPRSPYTLFALGTTALAHHLREAKAKADPDEQSFIMACDDILDQLSSP